MTFQPCTYHQGFVNITFLQTGLRYFFLKHKIDSASYLLPPPLEEDEPNSELAVWVLLI